MNATTTNSIRVFLQQLNVVRTRIGVDLTSDWLLGTACPQHGLPALDVRMFHETQMTVRGMCCEHWIDLINDRMNQLPNGRAPHERH
jgi:hypothetical protein